MVLIIILFIVSLGLNSFVGDLLKIKEIKEEERTETKETPALLTPPESLITLEPTEQVASLAGNIQTATEKIKALRDDAILYGISIRLGRNLIRGQGSETYIFGSPRDQDYWWTVTITQSNNSVTRAIIPKIDYMGTSLTYMQPDYWKINYIQAFQATERKGGEEFRKNHPQTVVTLDLTQSPPKDWLWWVVRYKDENSNAQLKVRVSANDGQVYTDDGELAQ